MQTLSPSLKLLLNVTIAQSIISRKFDGRLGSLGLTEFLILLQLNAAPEQKLRRIDLADAVGLTASGITRILAPMEKIGLIKREANSNDARVSYVVLIQGGNTALNNAIENSEELANRLLLHAKKAEVENASIVMQLLGGSLV
jgi:DNA-binding MarR family transcriptional regulator